jgi:hypothetical protein
MVGPSIGTGGQEFLPVVNTNAPVVTAEALTAIQTIGGFAALMQPTPRVDVTAGDASKFPPMGRSGGSACVLGTPTCRVTRLD